MVHLAPQPRGGQLLDHHVVDHLRHDRERHDLVRAADQLPDFLVLHGDHILPVHLEQLLIDQQSVAGGGRILHDRRNGTVVKLEPEATGRIFVQCNGTLEGSVRG